MGADMVNNNNEILNNNNNKLNDNTDYYFDSETLTTITGGNDDVDDDGTLSLSFATANNNNSFRKIDWDHCNNTYNSNKNVDDDNMNIDGSLASKKSISIIGRQMQSQNDKR